MTTPLPFVSCLCTTYTRKKLLENAIACFLAQDYPKDRCEMIVLDDANQYRAHVFEDNIHVVPLSRRVISLSEKHNVAASISKGDVLVVWDDDDVYLPWHISTHVKAIQNLQKGRSDIDGGSTPSRVLSNYGGTLHEEGSSGRFHGSIAFTRGCYEDCNGWPLTKRADFDQQFISRITEYNRCDPCQFAPPSYVFRWNTGHYHVQGFMKTPADETWYDQPYAKYDGPGDELLVPTFDEETKEIYALKCPQEGSCQR